MKSHSCRHQLGLAPGQRAIYALPDALLHNLFGLLRIALLLTQMIEQSFPLAKLRIVENRILNDLIALILVRIELACHSCLAALTNCRSDGLSNADCVLRLKIEGAAPSRLSGNPHEAPSPAPATTCGMY